MAWTVKKHQERVAELRQSGRGARDAHNKAYREALREQRRQEERD